MRISDWSSDVCSSDLAGFDDLVAYTQIKLPSRPKLELARNYWDEMGRGNAKGMHGPMLGDLAATLAVEPRIEHTVWESLALANAMTAMATCRRYVWQSIGALGVIEMTARSEEHTSELQSLMRNSYAVLCLKKKNTSTNK